MARLDQYVELAGILGESIKNISFPLMLLASGVLLILSGLAVSVYSTNSAYLQKIGKTQRKRSDSRVVQFLDSMTSIPPFKGLKADIQFNLSIATMEEEGTKLFSSLILCAWLLLSAVNLFLLRNIGQLWYVKLLLIAISVFLPYYLLTLSFDLYRHYMNRHIPQMIDEFRSAFIKHRKVKPALKECCSHIDKSLARVVLKAADAPYIEESLTRLRKQFDDIWFNVFVALILNYKNNGGELIDQLYKLNKTMTRYNNLEKKKNKRLIWYELFAVMASVFSIPAVFWLNSAILGNNSGVLIDTTSNMMISRIVGYSILSLIVVRVLRKM